MSNADIPDSPNSLRKYLAVRLAIAGSIISVLSGAAAYYLETKRVEGAAFDAALKSASHFRSTDIKSTIAAQKLAPHTGLRELLKGTPFVGLRIFDMSGKIVTEEWLDVPQNLRDAVVAHRHDFPSRWKHHHNWLTVNDDAYVQVVLPLSDDDKHLYGYFEGVYRLDPDIHHAQTERVRTSVATALVSTILAILLIYPLALRLTRRTLNLSQSLLESNIELMQTLGSAIAKRDGDTDAHNYRVTLYSVRLAEAMGRSNDEIATLIIGAFLHDVGKIGIPDQILRKPGKLTSEEFEVMKTHVTLGLDIATHTSWISTAVDVIQYHHEKFDGTGYPMGLAGEAIPLNARIFAVVDVFDALTSQRPYKEAFSVERSLAILTEGSDQHFDPRIVSVFQVIALDAYAEVNYADDIALRERMRQTIHRYFRAKR